MENKDITALANQAYLYGFPLVFNLEQINRLTETGIGVAPATPWNTFSHARTLAGPSDEFVTINNDTVYSLAPIDLSVGPVHLHVPDTAGRYYVFQFIDAWTDNFAYVGHRATGTKAGDYWLVPADWEGSHPRHITIIRFPTIVGVIVGRWACAGEADLAAVHALQDATTLAPLDPDEPPVGLDEPDPAVLPALGFLEKVRLWSQDYPPAARDLALQAELAAIGLEEAGASPYVDIDPDFADALEAGLAQGKETLAGILTSGSSPVVNGWILTLGAFNYNLDFFEVGALDDDTYKITDPTARIVERAAAALAGLWGNHAYEAAYIMTYVDDRGEKLSGEHSYTLRLNPLPPVDAFWSITMYNLPNFYLVANEIDRYSIGDRTPGLVYDEDGGLTVTISHAKPAGGKALANWLPAPDGEFRPVMRMYEPDAAVLDQSYVVPAITRTS